MSDKKRKPDKFPSLTSRRSDYTTASITEINNACLHDGSDYFYFDSPHDAERVALWLLRWAAWRRETSCDGVQKKEVEYD